MAMTAGGSRGFDARVAQVVAQFFDGLDLAQPGVVKVTEWRPQSGLEAKGPTSLWGGVGRKP
jgi:hypothetical protein